MDSRVRIFVDNYPRRPRFPKKKRTLVQNHEIWKTCRNCGHEFDARVELQLRCPKCNSTNIK